MPQTVNTIKLLHDQIRFYLPNPSFCIDATAGNGKDTLFLARLVGESGKVLAMDIQEKAVCATKELLEKKNLKDRVEVILDGHEHMDHYVKQGQVDCIMFNLGYLPGGNHKLATNFKTTITAIQKGLDLLKPGGIISLAIYQGGDTGFEEKECVLKWLKDLNCDLYTVMVTDFYNRPNYPPLAVFIIKEQSDDLKLQ